MKPTNGAVYHDPDRNADFVLVYICPYNKWGMLYLNQHVEKTLTCPMFQTDIEGQHAFSEGELRKYWNFNKWQKLDRALVFRKVRSQYAHLVKRK